MCAEMRRDRDHADTWSHGRGVHVFLTNYVLRAIGAFFDVQSGSVFEPENAEELVEGIAGGRLLR